MLCNERIMGDLLDQFQLGRASYELKAEESEVIRARFTTAPSPLYNAAHTTPVQLLSNGKNAKEFCAWKAQHPSILEQFEDFTTLLRGKRLAVFLDYDGTLTPIVKDPDRAFMSEQMRAAVRTVAGLFPTSIISGRGREKVEGFVQLKELFYAGSHGMDIVGPKANSAPGDEQRLAFQPAAKYAPIMDAVYKALMHRVQDIPGASVEHNKFCVSVHFRNCSPESYDAVVTAVKDTLHDHPNLKASRGRKVLEIQPQVDWGKGRALSHMLKALSLDKCDDVIPIYLGDDRTDEDAFKVLKERATGFGILISNKVKETDARYTLTDPSEVMAFLTWLVEWGTTTDNAWHSHQSCTGWSLRQQPPAPPLYTTPSSAPHPASHSSTDGWDIQTSPAVPDGVGLHAGTDRLKSEQQSSSSAGSSPGHSPTTGSAFATVRQFHGLPVAAGTSDRAMPASQWLTQTDPFSNPKPGGGVSQVPVTSPQEPAVIPETSAQHQAPDAQQADLADEYRQMGLVKCDSRDQASEAEEAGADSIEAEGRPPTGEEEDPAPPSRTSLDHYLNQPVKSSNAGSPHASNARQWDSGVTLKFDIAKASDESGESAGGKHGAADLQSKQKQQPENATDTGNTLPDRKRLTALLLDKLEGHEGHLPLQAQGSVEEFVSPPRLSNDSESSMAGYQSPFESLANEAMYSETDSVKAEDGSVKSLDMAPSM